MLIIFGRPLAIAIEGPRQIKSLGEILVVNTVKACKAANHKHLLGMKVGIKQWIVFTLNNTQYTVIISCPHGFHDSTMKGNK